MAILMNADITAVWGSRTGNLKDIVVRKYKDNEQKPYVWVTLHRLGEI